MLYEVITIPPLPETGPLEIRETLIAFNRMQQRLNRFVQDRTQMLAAISHDLRTPLTSLRLRSEFLPDSEDKERMQQTLQQMEAMLNATLSFARDDHHGEPVITSYSIHYTKLYDIPLDWAAPQALLTRPPLVTQGASSFVLPFDLHVLGLPPAFNLSHDQTLQLSYNFV